MVVTKIIRKGEERIRFVSRPPLFCGWKLEKKKEREEGGRIVNRVECGSLFKRGEEAIIPLPLQPNHIGRPASATTAPANSDRSTDPPYSTSAPGPDAPPDTAR